MKILALEFSSRQRSVAVVHRRHDRQVMSEVIETGGAGAGAVGLIDGALRQAGLEREEIDCLAVGLGPGSYTGVRLAIAVAQGWKLAREQHGLKLLGVSSADALAAQAIDQGLQGLVTAVINAQRGEFYLTSYDLAQDDTRQVEPLHLALLAEVQKRAASGARLIGPETPVPQVRLFYPRASALGRLAATRSDFIAGEKLEPIYLRETTFVKAPVPRINF